MDLAAERLLLPLDGARRLALRAAGPRVRRLLADRDARVGAYGLASVALALALTVLAPLWLLALGPLLLGVPHLLADLRYLVARQGLHRRPAFWPLVALPVALTWLYPRAPVGLAAVFGALVLARGPGARRAALAVPALAGLALALHYGRLADLAFTHLHNLVALALWWAWTRGTGRAWRLPTLALFAAGCALLALGAFEPWMLAHGALRAPEYGLSVEILSLGLAPATAWEAPTLALRCVLLFAFAQSVHYAAWLRLLPEEDRARPGLRSFRSSYRALVRDVGAPLVWGAGLLTAGLLAWGARDLVGARDGYLRLALCHGHLELAVAALLCAEGSLARGPA